MRRMLCVWFPLWPIQRNRHARPELDRQPLVLFAPVRGKLVVHACSPWAARHGVRPGMALGEARAVVGTKATMRWEKHDPVADTAALRKAALWCQRFSPLVAALEPDSVLIDVTGCAPLFGGEQKLAERVVAQLRAKNYAARAALADTAPAAWALAHFGSIPAQVAPPGRHRQLLRDLPVAALRLDLEVIATLAQLDIRRIGQLMDLPRFTLPARFGLEVLQRLDQALGDVQGVLDPEHCPEPCEASWTFAYPCSDRRLLENVLEQLLEQILAQRASEGVGIRGLLCGLSLGAAEPRLLRVSLLQPSQSPGYLLELMRLQLERVRLAAPVTAVTLRALTAPLEFQQPQLFETAARRGSPDPAATLDQFPTLVETLSNRLGKRSVLCPIPQADPQPEHAWRYEPWLEQKPRPARVSRPRRSRARRGSPDPAAPALGAGLPTPPHNLFRPLRLVPRPVPLNVISSYPYGPPARFTWQGRNIVITHSWGPERIDTGWWRHDYVHREYYLVESTCGARFWMFRELDDFRWFLQGEYR